ncbi:hypothetical protein SRABI96_04336 [Peribacillus sp. Bi96]|uniref:hypothetical protein n=1 Tax=Peribacillus sp. Bi96 TaxID=2884273 RepID=UPI001D6E8E7B|nr:hypothetical protein [Peribacillus sp. Bi96]CAH0293074.1 hypothetical protein SRABI96_04336 [Peribacillus sp. Bi96]
MENNGGNMLSEFCRYVPFEAFIQLAGINGYNQCVVPFWKQHFTPVMIRVKVPP